MRAIQKLCYFFFIPIVLLASACSKHEDPPTYELNVTDFVATMDENPETDELIGLIQYTIQSGSQVRFTILSQSPEHAIRVSLSGEVRVDEASIFDFETNPIISASVKCENLISRIGSESFYEEIVATKMMTVTISLNDLVE